MELVGFIFWLVGVKRPLNQTFDAFLIILPVLIVFLLGCLGFFRAFND